MQERLTLQIANELESALQSDNIAVFIDSKHLCVSTRGIRDVHSSTITTEFRGKFKEHETQQKFIELINTNTEF